MLTELREKNPIALKPNMATLSGGFKPRTMDSKAQL